MRKVTLTFGLIAGLIMSIMMVATVPFIDDIGSVGELIGYTTMILSFMLIYFGVRSYRDNTLGGNISFGKAFATGVLITVVATLLYVITWEILYHNFMPDFGEKYGKQMLEKMNEEGKSPAEIEQAVSFMKLYNSNILVNMAVTFLEPLPVGLLITFISSLMLKKK